MGRFEDRNQRHRKHALTKEMRGFFITCSQRMESRCITESIQLFDRWKEEYLDEEEDLKGKVNAAANSSSFVSTEDSLSSEVALLRKAEMKPFVSIHLENVKNLIFIRSNILELSPTRILEDILSRSDLLSKLGMRFICRCVPVDRICDASLSGIREDVSEMLDSFLADKEYIGKKYAVVLESRLNDSCNKKMIIEMIASLVGSRGVVDLTSPDYVIMVQIIKTKCGVSIIKDYYNFHKLNMQQIISPTSSTTSSIPNIEK